MNYENAIIVVKKTRLELLIERFNTKAQARFYIEHSSGNFADYQLEHDTFQRALQLVQEQVSTILKFKVLDRAYLPNFIFGEKDLILVLGQDGLVANTAKYAQGIPMLAINPDPDRFDGILLPFQPDNFREGIYHVLENSASVKSVTMAQVKLNDGQKLLAFNDFFIGPKTHISARYNLSFGGESEKQSSSGIIISTGAGSTGWLSSVFNMANGLGLAFGGKNTLSDLGFQMDWETDRLAFVVREPFRSIYTGVDLTAGFITSNESLKIESLMPVNGQIFSDGIESDFLNFNSGAIAEIGLAKEKANIVMA